MHEKVRRPARRLLLAAIILSVIAVFVIALSWILARKTILALTPVALYSADFGGISGVLRNTIEDEIGIYAIIPRSVTDLYLFDDNHPQEQTWFISFRSDIEGCRAFAEQVSGKGQERFSRYIQSEPEHAFIGKGPQSYGPQYATFPWRLTEVQNGVCTEGLGYYIVVDSDKDVVYLCMWETSGNMWSRLKDSHQKMKAWQGE
jgi:hypothetical protein